MFSVSIHDHQLVDPGVSRVTANGQQEKERPGLYTKIIAFDVNLDADLYEHGAFY